MVDLDTAQSLEGTLDQVKGIFAPKIVLVNHVKTIPVDNPCANLAIKYNMMYISVYQLIKEHIENNTLLGMKLKKSMEVRPLNIEPENDQFNETTYSAVNFKLDDVMELIQVTLKEKMQNQSYVLLEGLCNNPFIKDEEDKMALRYMDEIFKIEKKIGEVVGIIALQYHFESEFIREDELVYEVFPEPEVVEEPVKQEGDEEAEEEQAEAEEDDEEKKEPEFKPQDYKWTISDRNPKPLPVLYV